MATATTPSPGPGWVLMPNGGWVPPGYPGSGAYANTANVAANTATTAGANTAPVANTSAVANTVANTAPAPDTTFRNAILQQYQQYQTPVDANSAPIKAQTQAFDLSQARGLADTNRQIDEQAYAGGTLNSGGTNVALQKAAEDASANKANFLAGVLKDAETARQQGLLSTLNTGTQAETAANQLAQQADQFTKSQAQDESQFTATAKQQADQYATTLAENKREFDANADEKASEFAAQMGFNYKQLDQSDQEFMKNLAWQKEQAQLQAQLQREGMAASAGSASAALDFQKQQALVAQQEWAAQNPQSVIDAENQARIAKALAAVASAGGG